MVFTQRFPSPFGDLLFLIKCGNYDLKKCNQVSVPFRGFIVLNDHIKKRAVKRILVSVPFRGFIVLNIAVLGLSNHHALVSVPFRGFIVLNEKFLEDVLLAPGKFPSPFGDLLFLILFQLFSRHSSISFPSPFGDLLFLIGYDQPRYEFEFVSVPFRGFIVLNHTDSKG